MASGCSIRAPLTQPCSGRGVCANDSLGNPFCVCNAGWTSQGDYVVRGELDCNFNNTALTVLNTLWLAFAICALMFCSLKILQLWRVARKSVAAMPDESSAPTDKTPQLWRPAAASSCCVTLKHVAQVDAFQISLVSIVSSLSAIALTSYRLHSGLPIGHTAALTPLYVICGVTWYCEVFRSLAFAARTVLSNSLC